MSNEYRGREQSLASDPDMNITDHEFWSEGDFALISADGVRFRIDSLLLCWASSVLKDTIELGSKGDGKKELRLMDTEIESSKVLGHFLSLVTHGESPWPTTGTFNTAETFSDLITFLRKYDAERPLKIVRALVVNDLLLRRIPPFYVLMLAVAMDDVELSILAFKHAYAATVQAGEETFISAALLSLSPGSALEECTWPSQVLHRFPLDILWACTRAWTARWGSEYVYSISSTSESNGFHRQPIYSHISISSEYEKAIRAVRPLPKP